MINFWAQVLRKAKDMRIKVRTLPNKKLKNIFTKHYTEYKFLNVRYTNQEFPTGIFIFKDYVLNVTWGENPVATLIKSKENSKKWQNFFNEQWEKAK